MKKALSILAALALAGSLVACGGDDDSSLIPTSTAAPVTTDVPTTDPTVTDDPTGSTDGTEPSGDETDAEGTETRNGITMQDGGTVNPTTGGAPKNASSLTGSGVTWGYTLPAGLQLGTGINGLDLEIHLVTADNSDGDYGTNIFVVKSQTPAFLIENKDDGHGFGFATRADVDSFVKYTVGDDVFYSISKTYSGVDMTQAVWVVKKDNIVYEVVLSTTQDSFDALLPGFAEFAQSLK